MVFLDIAAGWSGSVHDFRVLRNPGLYQTGAIKFPGDTHLLGDGGYVISKTSHPVIQRGLLYSNLK